MLPTPLRVVLDDVPFPSKTSLVRELHQHGYDINERWLPRAYRGFALQYCVTKTKDEPKFGEVSHLLLNLGADPSLPEDPVRSKFRRTIETGSWGLYKALMRHSWIDLNAQDHYGQTVVHHMVQHGPLDRLIDLVENYRVDVNIQDMNG